MKIAFGNKGAIELTRFPLQRKSVCEDRVQFCILEDADWDAGVGKVTVTHHPCFCYIFNSIVITHSLLGMPKGSDGERIKEPCCFLPRCFPIKNSLILFLNKYCSTLNSQTLSSEFQQGCDQCIVSPTIFYKFYCFLLILMEFY